MSVEVPGKQLISNFWLFFLLAGVLGEARDKALCGGASDAMRGERIVRTIFQQVH